MSLVLGSNNLGVADVLIDAVSTTTPAANANIALITAPPPGIYWLRIVIALTGTAETQLANLNLRVAGVNWGELPTISGQVVTIEVPRVTLTANDLAVRATALATTGAIYTVSLVAFRIG